MRTSKTWSAWAVYETAARPIITTFQTEHGRAPTRRDLVQLGHRWIYDAAYCYHGGFPETMVRLGFTPSKFHPRRFWDDWETFAAAARPILDRYVAANGRIPSQAQLESDRQSWLVAACARHHGGYRVAIERLGYTYPPRRFRRTGLRDWEHFAQRALPILKPYVTKSGHSPTQLRLRHDGHEWIYMAAFRYHGGFPAAIARLGLPPIKSERQTLENWQYFKQRFEPVLARYIKRLGRSPNQAELRQGGDGWISQAVGLHGGYARVLERLDLPLIDRAHWRSWEKFQAKAEPILQAFQRKHGRPPSGAELHRQGQSWLPRAAQQYHGGYPAALRRLKLVHPVHPRKGKGLTDPAVFLPLFRLAVAEYVQRHGACPSHRQLTKAGHSRLVRAAIRAHGGYLSALKSVGAQPRPNQVPRPRLPWNDLHLQLQELRRLFPREMKMGILPSYLAVQRRCPSLTRYWSSRKIPWPTVARQFRLLSMRQSKPHLRYLRAVEEALAFYRQHNRWPTVPQASPALREVRFRHTVTWEAALTRTDLPSPLFGHLVELWREHFFALRRQGHPQQTVVNRLLNKLTIAYNEATQSPTPAAE